MQVINDSLAGLEPGEPQVQINLAGFAVAP